tara:strand:+ start:2172 stop:3983 length:1812 start_codon:yes stop_codon:yes gene_type:complete
MSFFVSSDKIKVGQQSVAIPAENGLNYSPGGRIDIYVPPTSKFIDLSQSKLHMEVDLSIPAGEPSIMRLQLDAETGLHSLISSIRIYTGRKTALLEEIQGYDVLSALKFDYNTNQSLSGKRALTEGCTTYDPACRSSTGCTRSKAANCFSNPYFSKVDDTTATLNVSFLDAQTPPNQFTTVKGLLSLNTGLFQNDAVFPAVLTDGIFIEILLKDAKQVFRKLDTTNYFRRTKLCPMFHSTNGSDAPNAAAGNGSLINGGTTTTIFVTRANNQTSQSTFPFVVGQSVALALENSVITTAASFTTVGKIRTIENVSGATVGESKTKITLAAAITNNTGKPMGRGSGGNYPNASLAFLVDATTFEGQVAAFDPSFSVKNVEMIIEQIEVPDGYEATMLGMMREGGTINYDYRSFTNYRYSQVKDDLVANIRLPLIESRATSILCIPTDATPYSNRDSLNCSNTYLENNETNDIRNHSSRSGIVGVVDELQNYQLIYDGRINPSRKVDVTKISSRTSISQQWVIEAEKALAMADIEPLSFLSFQSNFFIGRALALGRNSVYDARGKDFNLQVEYTGVSGPAKSHLWNNFCAHIRRLEIKNGSVSVQI